MMGALLEKLVLLIFGGGAVTQISTGAVKGVAISTALVPFLLWLLEHKDEKFIDVTYGEATFWGSLMVGVIYLALHLPSPRQPQQP